MKLLKLMLYYCAIFAVALCFMTYLRVHSPYGEYAPNAFAISGRLANGDAISGTVRITTKTGSFDGGPVLITGPRSFTLDEILPGYKLNSKIYVGEATITQPECPILFFGVQTSHIQRYAGGSMTPDDRVPPRGVGAVS